MHARGVLGGQRCAAVNKGSKPHRQAASRGVRAQAATSERVAEYEWKGTDEFSDLDDRKALQPLPLPPLKAPKRIVLVRHGQSTWNAEGRIQGSTDFAVLTEKGTNQAKKSRDMLEDERFDKMFHSPLKRAAETAELVNPTRHMPIAVLPSLREIDLYSFQGLMKADGQELYGDKFTMWQKAPADFEIDEQLPVQELWYRASLAWQEILKDEQVISCALVVAHNAVNQALVATAAGLSPRYFRRLLQSNAASTVLDFVPRNDGEPPVVTIDRLNQSPDAGFIADKPEGALRKRIFLVRHGATVSSEENKLPTSSDEPVSALGEVQSIKVGEFLMDATIDSLLASPAERAVVTAGQIAKCQSLTGDRAPRLQILEELADISVGMFGGRAASEVQHLSLPDDAENMSDFWQRCESAWRTVHDAAMAEGGSTVCVVAHAAVHAALICHCLGLTEQQLGRFRMSTAGVTVIEFPHSDDIGIIRCHNFTAHLGRWAVPITQAEEETMVCGIDGCF